MTKAFTVNCHACARAIEIDDDEEGLEFGIYVVPEGSRVTCGHCGRVHESGYEMEERLSR